MNGASNTTSNKANYYWRLKRVRQACLEQFETPSGNFVELLVPTPQTVPSASIPATMNANPSTVAVLRAVNGISVEIKDNATEGFIKNLIRAFANA